MMPLKIMSIKVGDYKEHYELDIISIAYPIDGGIVSLRLSPTRMPVIQ